MVRFFILTYEFFLIEKIIIIMSHKKKHKRDHEDEDEHRKHYRSEEKEEPAIDPSFDWVGRRDYLTQTFLVDTAMFRSINFF